MVHMPHVDLISAPVFADCPNSGISSPYKPSTMCAKIHSVFPDTCLLWKTPQFLVFVVLMFVILTACTGRDHVLDRIQTTGVLRIAIDPSFAPFEYVDEDDLPAGFDIDLSLAIADALGVKPQFVTTGYDALYDAVTVGRADIIISALYPDPSRTAAFAYSVPYFNGGDVLLVTGDSPVSSLASLGGKRVACLFGTEGHMTALGWQKTMTLQPVIITTNSPYTLTDALVAGKIDAVIMDHVTALMTVENHNSVQILPDMITDEPYVVAGRLEDKELIKAIDDIIATLIVDGTLQRLIQKWMR
ncbi:MAG: amino acid ABC transporter substrate-binding protein [Anaerolineales bacterium]|nr:MAG: amino acid ABC transporter substrate-binding protein [Anaerolineales bacterium]